MGTISRPRDIFTSRGGIIRETVPVGYHLVCSCLYSTDSRIEAMPKCPMQLECKKRGSRLQETLSSLRAARGLLRDWLRSLWRDNVLLKAEGELNRILLLVFFFFFLSFFL